MLKHAQCIFNNSMEALMNFAHSSNVNIKHLVTMSQSMATALKAGYKIMVCGNGGSACQAMHFAEELTGRYRADREPLAALSLTDASHITCIANDYGYESVFSRAVQAYGKPGDHLLILSTSGNSANLVKAAEMAKSLGIEVCALLGRGGGAVKNYCNQPIIAPGESSDMVQNVHMVAIHALIEMIEVILFPHLYN